LIFLSFYHQFPARQIFFAVRQRRRIRQADDANRSMAAPAIDGNRSSAESIYVVSPKKNISAKQNLSAT
jgi:hypothetical protein